MSKRSVAIRLAGHEYRLKSDADEAHLQRVANYLDESMARIRKNTGTVDSLDVAILTALNITRELVELRDALGAGSDARSGFDADRLQSLIELIESSTSSAAPRGAEARA